MIRIALDLELEQPNTNRQSPDSLLSEEKIIQVGWVVFETSPFSVLCEKCYNINIGVPLSQFIKNLTRISDEDISNGNTLDEVYEFLKKDLLDYKASRVVAQWGSGDMECLKKELDTPSDWAFGRSGLNVKHLYQAYADVNGMNMSGGLSKCMGRLGLKWLGTGKHNALNDARNTAQMYSKLISYFLPSNIL